MKTKKSERDFRQLSRGERTSQWLVAGIVGLIAALYLLVFLTTSVGGGETKLTRIQLFLVLLAPDDVLANAVGDRFRWQGIVDRLWATGWSLVVVLHAAAIGWWPLKWIEGKVQRPWWEQSLFAVGIGLHLMSLITLAVGLVGLLYTPVLRLLLPSLAVVAVIASVITLRRGSAGRDTEPLPAKTSAPSPVDRRVWMAGIAVAAVFAVIIVLGAALPPWDFDVLEYHLQVPKEWFQAGRIEFLPHNIYANMPLDAEMLPLVSMSVLGDWWAGAIAGKTAMGACAILTALAIYGLVRRLSSPLAAIVAALVWLSHPWVIHVSISGLNEQVYALYLTLAVSAVAEKDASWRNWVLAGVFAGSAAACKYPAVVMFVMPLAVWAAIAPRLEAALAAPWRLRLAALTCFVVAVVLSGGAWYVKNWVQAGNPVYPLLGNVLDGKTRTPEKNAQFARGHAVPPYTAGKLHDSLVQIGWKSDHQSPLLVPLVLLGLAALATKRRGMTNDFPPLVIGVLSVVIFFVATWWLLTHRLDRFLVPIIPLAAWITGLGVEYAKSRALKWVVSSLLAVGLLYNLAYVCQPTPLAILALGGDNRWLVPLEELRRDEPRRDTVVSRLNADVRWLNAHVPPGKAVLCVGEAGVFDLQVLHYYHTCFDDCLLVNWMASKSATERKQLLHERNIAFVYVDWGEIDRYQAPGNYGFDPRFSRALLDELVAQKILGPPLSDAPLEMYPVLP